MALWIADGTMGLRKEQGPPVTPPCFALCQKGACLYAAGEQTGYCICPEKSRMLYDFPLPRGVCAMAGFGPFVCALSRETDSLCAFSPENGALCFSVPAGSYPRDFALSPCGKYLAIAGSAAGEVLVLNQELHCVQKIRVAGACISVCFVPDGLAVLCAMGDEMLSSRLLHISPRGVTEEAAAFPHAPLCLCALPSGSLMMGCHGSVLQFNPRGRQTGRLSTPLPVRIRAAKGGVLIADSYMGMVLDGQKQPHYQGPDPADMCCL